MSIIKYTPRAVALRNDVINAFRELIDTYGKNNKLSLEAFGNYRNCTSIEYEPATNDIVFNHDEDNDDFTLAGDYDLEAFCELYDDILCEIGV